MTTSGRPRTNTGGRLPDRVANFAREFLSALFMSLRTAQIHDSTNQAYQTALARLHQSAEALFAATGGFEVRVVDDSFFVNGARLQFDQGSGAAMRILRHLLEQQSLGGFSIQSSPTVQGLLELIGLVANRGGRDGGDAHEELPKFNIGVLGLQKIVDTSSTKIDRSAFGVHTYAKLILTIRDQIRRLQPIDQPESARATIEEIRAVRVVQDLVELLSDRIDLLLRLATNTTGAAPEELYGVNSCVMSIAMGYSLGFHRRDLVDIGVGALFHHLGSVVPGHGGRADHAAAVSLTRLLGETGIGRSLFTRAMIVAEQQPSPEAGRDKAHPFSRVVRVAAAFSRLLLGSGNPSEAHLPVDVLATMRRDPTGWLDLNLVDLLMNLLRAYPPGTNVVLASEQHAVVATPLNWRWDRPVVRVASRPPRSVDLLAQQDDAYVDEIVGTQVFLGAEPPQGQATSAPANLPAPEALPPPVSAPEAYPPIPSLGIRIEAPVEHPAGAPTSAPPSPIPPAPPGAIPVAPQTVPQAPVAFRSTVAASQQLTVAGQDLAMPLSSPANQPHTIHPHGPPSGSVPAAPRGPTTGQAPASGFAPPLNPPPNMPPSRPVSGLQPAPSGPAEPPPMAELSEPEPIRPTDSQPPIRSSTIRLGQPRPDRLLGSFLAGKYRILEKIGEGGMGTVFLATQEPIDRQVAVKVLHHSLANDNIAVRRFQREARVISRMRHPNTVTVYDFGQTQAGELYLVMEFLEGQTVAQLLHSIGPLPGLRAANIIRQACGSLSEAHELGIIHRDLKPDNIFLTRYGDQQDFVKVLDFGLVKLADTESIHRLTQQGKVYGTPRYMAPEQAEGKAIDHRSDIYTLGVVLYELLTGRPLFMAETMVALLVKHIQTPPPPMAAVRPDLDVDPRLESIVMWALAKKAGDRPQTVSELARELERWSLEAQASLGPSPTGTLPGNMPVGTIAPSTPSSNPGPGHRWTKSGPGQVGQSLDEILDGFINELTPLGQVSDPTNPPPPSPPPKRPPGDDDEPM